MLQPRTKPVETHYENTYFFRWPWEKGLSSQIKRPFPLSPFAMFFAITKEMHTGAVRPKQHCSREGGEFVPFGHEDCMARNWKLLWNVSTVLSGVVAFPFFVDMLDFEGSNILVHIMHSHSFELTLKIWSQFPPNDWVCLLFSDCFALSSLYLWDVTWSSQVTT